MIKKKQENNFWDIFKILFQLLLSFLFGFFVFKLVSGKSGKVKQEKNWMPIPLNKDQILVQDKQKKWIKVELPKDKTGESIAIESIKAVGYGTIESEQIKIEIKHNKQINIPNNMSDSDMSI